MLINDFHPINAPLPIDWTLFGNFKATTWSKLANARSPIVVTLSGIITLVTFWQSAKASFSIVTILSGIFIWIRLSNPANARSPITFALVGIVVFLQAMTILFVTVSITALQLSRLSYFEFPSVTTMVYKLLQPSKAFELIDSKLFGKVILFKLVIFAKA